MRIAYVSSDTGVPVFGTKGCSVHLQEMVGAFCGLGAHVDVFSPSTKGDANELLSRAVVRRLPKPTRTDGPAYERAKLKMNRALFSALRLHGPYDLVYERYSLWSYAGIQYAAEERISAYLEVNAPLIAEQSKHRSLYNVQGAEAVLQRLLSRRPRCLAVSEEVGRYLIEKGAIPDDVQVQPNGVNTSRISPDVPPSVARERDVVNIGFVGTLKPWHGVPSLVEACSLLQTWGSPFRLFIVGDGPERRNLERLVYQHRLESRTSFLGAIEPQEMPAILTSLDIGVAPYSVAEGFYFSPLKIYEYMAAGLAVVSSSLGQPAQTIDHGHNGLLYTPGSSTELACCLRRLVSDSVLRSRLGEQARQDVVARHQWRHIAKAIIAGVRRQEETRHWTERERATT
ncbi:MAG: glycosyltransferase family 4 protein [Bdellovibrionales bacterium]|nr:glycosyltransferase family 4 protein [Bdellovibrionales bacterium]